MAVLPSKLTDLRERRMSLHFRVDGGGHYYSGETIGVSPNQFIMATLAKLAVGSRLLVSIRVPVEVSGSSFCDVAVSGSIVSVSRLSDGKFGYQVEMEHC
jgi:hypothetical protein